MPALLIGTLRFRGMPALLIGTPALLRGMPPLLIGTPAAQAPTPAAPYTVVSREGRRPLATRTISGQEMFALDDLARLFELTVREDTAAGGLTVTVRNQTIVLSPGQSLASVGGRLISLPAPPVREGRSWYVPVDFVPRAIALVLGSRVELRKPSRLVLLGDIRAPRVAGRIEPLGSLARLTLDVAPATPHTVSQDGQRLIIRFEADMLDAALPAIERARSHPERPARRRAGGHRHRSRPALRVVPLLGRARARRAGAASSSTSSARRPSRSPGSPRRHSRRNSRHCSNSCRQAACGRS